MNSANPGIEDVQSRVDSRNISVTKVGIKDIKYPLHLITKNNQIQTTLANFTMTVKLPPDVKGTHMSRFVELLHEHQHPIAINDFHLLLEQMLPKLQAELGEIVAKFTYFLEKTAPVSKVKSLLDYEVVLKTFAQENDNFTTELKVVVPITSLCPCSKEISEYGAHNQRSHITLTVTLSPNHTMTIEDLIGLAERHASCELYGLLKRSDEKYVTERAYENPKFVEDLVRDIACELKQTDGVEKYIVESENFESIHNHSAYAMIKS